MISLGNRRLWLYGAPVDMRKGIDGLVGVVLNHLGREPMSGDVFLFVGRNASRLKLLCWDRDGYWLATKRLSLGRFQVPRGTDSQGRPSAIELTATEWQLILDGIVVHSRSIFARYGR